jgi:preprotein translocase subunit SecY
MWLGEQITERGIGNGISLIIFAGIVTDMPDAAVRMFSKAKTGDITAFDLAVIGLVIVLVVAVIIFFERGQRRIPVQYAKRVVGRKIVGGQSSHLPLKVNTAGVIPPIFASSILMFPQQIASFVQTPWMQRISEALHPGDWRYNLLYVGLIVFFCYFYTAVTFNPVDVADNMKKYGGFIPGIRPGRATAAYINKVLTRITFGGAVYISAICVLPSLLHEKMKVPFYFGGTGLMIVVGVALDTVQQIESHLITRNYEGFTGPRGPRIRGRGGRGTGAVGAS